MNIKNVGITLNVLDIDRSIAFYSSIGFALKSRWENYYAEISAPGLIIGLHPTNVSNLKGNSGNSSIGISTEDFDETRSHLQSLSIDFSERNEEGGQFLNFYDPDGSAIYIIKPKY